MIPQRDHYFWGMIATALIVVLIDAIMDVLVSPSPGRDTAQNVIAGVGIAIVAPLFVLRARQTIRRLRGQRKS